MTQAKRDFATEIVLIKHKAGSLGLFKTMQALEEAVKQVGWEIAEQLEEDAVDEAVYQHMEDKR